MDEAEFWSVKLRPKLIRLCISMGLRHHFERIENMVADGTPDVDYCITGNTGKIELKFSPTHPRSEMAQVLGKQHGMRRSQIVYASRRTWAGGRAFCMVGTPEAVWLLDLSLLAPPAMADIATATSRELQELSVWSSTANTWEELISVLCGSSPL